jgi:hypothetical protein
MSFGICALGEFDVARLRILDALGAADLLRRGNAHQGGIVQHRLDLQFLLVRQLEAVGPEDLDAIVGVRIMRGRDHDAEVGPHGARQHRDRRRGHRAEQEHVHARREKAGGQRILDHVARKPRVLADHHAVTVAAAPVEIARRHADLQHHVCRHGAAVRRAAHAIGSEILARHLKSPAQSPLASGSADAFATASAATVPFTSCTRRMCAP